ncbi:MAG: UDP-N-acetylmuramate dehydrogenase [Bacteroides sp.]|nr:UDP-N-acetylmuramate dehydrogenase [Bacteroides sp.]MCM1380086.1 UDP-N-acetylmuramate dehydrogenase [Bacteroides sp.]MCM1446423.1 UDP-N-acetylmuramate dehydrogenase [Prevotella sp.]
MKENVKIRFDADVSELTTFGVAAQSAAVAEWQTPADLRAILADESLPRPLKVIGGGSNLLFTKSFGGTLLLRSGEPEVRLNGLQLYADGHAVLDDLCELAAAIGLRGMENLSGIPGSLGGALVQNAGAYGAETGDLLLTAEFFDLQTGEIFTAGRDWMSYSYRSSRLKEEIGRYVILSAYLQLQPGDTPANLGYGNLRATLGDAEPTPMAVREAVLITRDSKLPNPAFVGSAGSFFRNPEVGAEKLLPEMPRFELGNGLFKVPAAWLIDHVGMKGASEGGASTWPSQPLVIVNTLGRATAADVLNLESRIINAVRERYGITLIPEVEHI